MGFVTFASFDDTLSISHKKSTDKSFFSPEISLRTGVTFIMVRSVQEAVDSILLSRELSLSQKFFLSLHLHFSRLQRFGVSPATCREPSLDGFCSHQNAFTSTSALYSIPAAFNGLHHRHQIRP